MGSFNEVCIVSGLPIEAGTRIRFLVLARSQFHKDGNGAVHYVSGRWQMHGIPIKGKYNDYGSVEDIEDSFTTQMFFEGIKRGAVERGVGDNTCHDIAVKADMDRNGWLQALREGRVSVLDRAPYKGDWKPEEHEPEKGIPSVRRIEKVLTDAGLKIAKSAFEEAFNVDEPVYAYIRVRYGAHNTEGPEVLKNTLPIIQAAGYAAMVTVGSGAYANTAEMIVAPLPNPDIHIHGLGPVETYNDERPLAQSMIREDVWKILLGITISDFRGDFTLQGMQESALLCLEEELAYRAKAAEVLAKMVAMRDDAERSKISSDMIQESLIRAERLQGSHRENTFFAAHLRGHEGVSGYRFKEAFELAIELAPDPEQLKQFVLNLAETMFAQWAYSHLCGQWHPITNGRQDSPWEELRAFHLKLSQIKGKWEDEEGDEEDEDDESDLEDIETDDERDDLDEDEATEGAR